MGNKWATLRAKMTPERREANRLASKHMIAAMPFVRRVSLWTGQIVLWSKSFRGR
jgi:hypothetical protein